MIATNNSQQMLLRVTVFLLIAGVLVGGVLYAMVSMVASYTSPYAISIAPWLLFFVLVVGVMIMVALLLVMSPKLVKGLRMTR